MNHKGSLTEKINYNWEILALTRFVLAMIVLLQHIPAIFDGYDINIPWYNKRGAFEAVLGFLLISGLSIGNSLQKNRSTFFKRRLQRIYPVYVASILLHYAVHAVPLSIGFLFFILLNLTFLNQIFSLSYVVVAWSLSLEVWLYALAPLLYKLSFKTLMIIIYASFAAFLFHIIGRTKFHWPYYVGVKYGLNLLLLSFIWITGFVYSVYPQKRKFLATNVVSFFAVYMVVIVTIQLLYNIKHHKTEEFFNNELFVFAVQFLCLAFVYIVVFYNHYITNLSASTKWVFNLLGNISYPLYLTHRSVFIFLNNHKIANPIVAIFTAIFIAFLVYWLFDFYSKKRTSQMKTSMIPAS
jgi:peptidoglycan/LPS O-acetylase OafA/YrhL